MISVGIVSIVTLLYLGLLFGVAQIAEKKRLSGRSITSNPSVYVLSLAVHFTSWTFYGLVGQAATTGVAILAAYLGPTLMAFSWWFLLRKMVRISKEQNITSIADFISSRYGKSALFGALVTIFSIVANMPQIALQLKAIARTFDILTVSSGTGEGPLGQAPFLPGTPDTACIVAIFLCLFSILFGARSLDVSERQEGLVAAIALQSLVKLIAFISVGIFVTYGLFDGFSDIFARFARQFPDRGALFLLGTPQVPYVKWFSWLFISMMAVMFLPRQFHIAVIENSDEEHIRDAMWRFPLYAFLITLFAMPIALGGIIAGAGSSAGADFFVINLPLQAEHRWLALLVFIGGFSASAGMVMLESVVLGTMILHYLLMPLLLKRNITTSDISGVLINAKRGGIVAVIFLGYLYYRFIGETSMLVDIGVATSVAATQFAPAMIGGLYWKRATRRGAMTGLALGFLLWFYTVLIPLSVQSGWLSGTILQRGPFGLALLRPLELFGMSGLDMVSHALFWTLFFNLGAFVAFSLLSNPDQSEAEQAVKFVDVLDGREAPVHLGELHKGPDLMEFARLMTKFIGEKKAQAAVAQYLAERGSEEKRKLPEHEFSLLKRFTERVLAGSVGASAASVIVDSYFATRGSELENVFDMFGTVTLSRTASREQLSLLYEAARIVAGGADLQVIVDNILGHLQQQFKFDMCVFRILDEEKRCLVVRGQKGMSSRFLDEADRELDLDTYAGAAFLTNSMVVVNDTDHMEKEVSAGVIRGEGIQSFAVAPVTIEGKPIGVLSVFSKSTKGCFTGEFVELFATLAGHIGIALRNALQTEKLIRAKEHEKEMQIARTVQLALLPTAAPSIEGISLAGTCLPACEVGGDYYDFLPQGSDSLGLVIADVSGHNVGAALIMSEVRTFVQTAMMAPRTPVELMSALNEFLYDDLTRAELFITMFYLHYAAGTRELSYANAGHNPPLLWSSDTQSCEWLDAEGLILGVTRKVIFEEKLVQLHQGDILLLYTDGIVEATDSTGAFFGTARLCEVLKKHNGLSPQRIMDQLLEQLHSFAQSQCLTDDVTLVVLKVC